MPSKNIIKEYSQNSYYHIYSRGANKQKLFLRYERNYTLGLISSLKARVIRSRLKLRVQSHKRKGLH